MNVNTKKGSASRIKLTKRERDALEYAASIASQIGRMSDSAEVAGPAKGAAEYLGKLQAALTKEEA